MQEAAGDSAELDGRFGVEVSGSGFRIKALGLRLWGSVPLGFRLSGLRV